MVGSGTTSKSRSTARKIAKITKKISSPVQRKKIGSFTRMMLRLAAFFSFFGMKYIYSGWSKLWRFLLDGKYKNVAITPSVQWKPAEVLAFFTKECKWVKDPWYYVDVISRPQRFWVKKQGDCDEYACFAGTVMNKYNGCILSVNWYNPQSKDKKFGGHNVYVFKDGNAMWHIGNWGLFGPYTKGTWDTVARSIVTNADSGAIMLAYSVRDPQTLKFKGGRSMLTKELK